MLHHRAGDCVDLVIILKSSAVKTDFVYHKPVLIVHGEADATVPFENAKLLFDACPGQKDCLFVPGARHVESMYRAPGDYAQALDRMIDAAFGSDRNAAKSKKQRT